MWAFAETCRSLADGCRTLGLPVTGGNVSFYNATGDTAVLPTPVIGVMGVLDDVERRTPVGFSEAGDSLVLPGDTRGRSAWPVWRTGIWVATRRPSTSSASGCLARSWSRARATGCCRRRTTCPTGASRSRSWSRACVSGTGRGWCCPRGSTRSSRCSASRPGAPSSRCRARRSCGWPTCARRGGLPWVRIGVVDTDEQDAALDVQDVLTVPLTEPARAFEGTLPALFGSAV